MYILMDLDNVLLKTFKVENDGRQVFYWSENLEQDLGLTAQAFASFFDEGFMTAKTTKPVLEKWLDSVGSSVSADTFTDYWLKRDTNLDTEVWTWAKKQHNNGHILCLASNQAQIRYDYLFKKYPDLAKVFKTNFSSHLMGVIKPSPAFFEYALNTLQAKPADVVFIDDSLKNVTAARKLGIASLHFAEADELYVLDTMLKPTANKGFSRQRIDSLIKTSQNPLNDGNNR